MDWSQRHPDLSASRTMAAAMLRWLAPTQLEMPQGNEVARWRTTVEGAHPVSLEVALEPGAAQVSLLGLWPEDDDDRAETSVMSTLPGRDAPAPSSAGQYGAHWTFSMSVWAPVHMEVSTVDTSFGLYMFGDIRLEPALAAALEPAAWMARFRDNEAGTRLMPLFEALRVVQAYLFDCMDHSAMTLARRFDFDDGTRWRVYGWTTGDPTGRIAQAAEVCPGILIAASALESGNREASTALLEMVIAGRKLNHVVDAAVTFLVGHDANAGLRQAQRTYISRATPRVPRWCISAPDVAVIPEDIPASDRDNLHWFLQQHNVHEFLTFADHVDPELRKALFHYASAHPEGLWGHGTLWYLIEFLNGTGRRPARATPPRKLLLDSDRWRADIDLMSTQPVGPTKELLAGRFLGFDTWQCEGVKIDRLRLAIDLGNESTLMRHCVATRAPLGANGSRQFFHADMFGEKVTIEASWPPDAARPFLHEASGVANAKISARAKESVERWLAAVAGAAAKVR